MVEVDGGDHRDIGIDQVDRIQAATESDFEDREVEPAAREQPQRGQRAVFEIGQRETLPFGRPGHIQTCRFHGFECLHQRGVACVLSVDAHALVVVKQVRRGIGADLPARRTRDRLDEGDGRTLAVGAAHDDDVPRRLAQAHARGNLAHAVEPHVDGFRMLALDVGEPVG